MNKKQAGRLLIGFVFYFIGILIHLSHTDGVTFISDIGIEHASWVEWGMFGIAYFIIGGDVVYKAVRGILRREFFDENLNDDCNAGAVRSRRNNGSRRGDVF